MQFIVVFCFKFSNQFLEVFGQIGYCFFIYFFGYFIKSFSNGIGDVVDGVGIFIDVDSIMDGIFKVCSLQCILDGLRDIVLIDVVIVFFVNFVLGIMFLQFGNGEWKMIVEVLFYIQLNFIC